MAECAHASRGRRPRGCTVGGDIARKFLRGIYAAMTLFAGDVLFNEIGVL